MADRYISGRQEVINRLKACVADGPLPLGDVIFLISELERLDYLLEDVKDRIDDAGFAIPTSRLERSIGYERWSRSTPRGPVTAHPENARRIW